jgi:hypothetical protein
VSAEPEPGTVMAALGPAEARRLTDEVKRDVQALWAKLVKLHEGGAHLALGYPSWAGYMTEEFGVGQSQAYRLLDAGRVVAAIEGHSPNGEPLPAVEAQARELVPLLRECGPEAVAALWRDVASRGDDVTAEHLRDAVAWANWASQWQESTGHPPLTLDDFRDMLRKPLEIGGKVIFAGFTEIDEEKLREAHCGYLLEHVAPGLLLQTGKVPPPPPGYKTEVPRRAISDRAVHETVWALRVERGAGLLLWIADALSEREEEREKGIAVARAEIGEPFASEWDDDGVKHWALGHVRAAMESRA